MTGTPFTQDLSDCRDVAVAGGKAVNLGRLLRGGFPVPAGFVITTHAYRHATTNGNDGSSNGEHPFPHDLADQVRAAYASLGGGPVAVRSSATAEDLAGASMAGQYETFLHVEGDAALLDAVRRCWASLDTPRTRAYLREHGIDAAQVAMAVVVQRLVPADVAGVLFTADPRTGARREMLVEASWGLGEAVVAGRVQPDVLRIDARSGRVVHAAIADKRVHVTRDGPGERPVDAARRRKPCLRPADVARLWQLGRAAAEHFGAPQDLEWAVHNGDVFLLQSRPITTLAEAEAYEQVLRDTRAELRDKLARGRGPWVLHNLAETLPHPTPLTWGVIRRFMTGAGGYGAMYRAARFEPSPDATRDGFLDLVAGRVYMDASRAPGMFFAGFPFRYDVERLRRDPEAGQSPPTVPTGTLRDRARASKRLAAVDRTLRATAIDLDARLTRETFPAFLAWCRVEAARDLAALSDDELIDLWHRRERAVLDDFAPQSLLPSLVAGMALADLRSLLAEHFWDDDPDALAHLLSSGGDDPDATVRSDAELYEVAHGRQTVEQWLADHGYRAAGEFDLAAPRWRECPALVAEMAARLRDAPDPLERHREHARKVAARLDGLRASLPSPGDRAALDDRVALARRYVAFREGGKDVLMHGYALLRDAALEVGRRLEVADDVFLLSPEDLLDALRVGFAPQQLMADRKAARRAEARVYVPRVIDAGAVEQVGEPPEVRSADALKGRPLSTGCATGTVRIVRSPTDAGELGRGYVLVCPSTDPSWTPLFAAAAGLVLECGGALSHGAVVAREMGLPAVVLPDATRLLNDGEAVTVDGHRGLVSRLVADALPTPSPPYPGERAGVRGRTSNGVDGALGGANILPARAGTVRTERDEARSLPADAGGTPAPQLTGLTSTDARPLTPALSPEYGGEGVCPSPDDPNDTTVPPRLVPPPPGRIERRAARWRNRAAVAWGVYLLALFVLPDVWVLQPSLRALDLVLWPAVRVVGKPATVALVAAGLAVLTMTLQRILTDNARLREAKRRAAILQREASSLPGGSPRRAALLALASPVQWRVTGAAFVPLGLLIGPLVLTFLWFPARVDPAAANAPPGSPVTVVATVDAELRTPVTVEVAPPLALDESAPPVRGVEPIRETLTKLLAAKRSPATLPADLPPELTTVVERVRAEEAADLQAYLDAGVPPQPLSWTIRTPAGKAGRWPVSVHAGDGKPLRLDVVLGDRHPPAPTEASNPPDARVKSLNVVYQREAVRRGFFDDHWLIVYLLAYLPAMFAARLALRVA